MDIASYSSDSRSIIKIAKEVAAEFKHPEIEVEHLLVATVRQEASEVESILAQLGKNPNGVASLTETYLKEQSSRAAARENLTASPATQAVLAQAIEEKAKLYDALVEPEHILIAIFDPRSALAPYLREKLDIAKEEKTHMGEFQRMLLNRDKEQVEELEKGKEEVKDEVGE